MTAAEIDDYFAQVDEPARSTLEEMRRRILAVRPDAEQGISYRLPAFRVQGRVVAGLGAFARHLSYFPHSGSVLGRLGGATQGYGGTKSALHFPLDEPLPQPLVERLVTAKLEECGLA